MAFIAASLAAGIVWGPIGPVVIEPLVRRYGENSIPALRVTSVEGSLYFGITLNGVSLTSGDDILFDADRLGIRPSWEELRHGSLWLSDLEIERARVNVENLSALASRYGQQSGESPEPSIKPIRVALRGITLDTPAYQIEIDEALLARDGFLTLSAALDGFPVRADGILNFDPLQAISFDISIGSGRAFLEGRLTEPFDVKVEFRSIRLGELLAILPDVSAVPADGEIEGSFSVAGSGKHLEAQGYLGLKNASAAGLPIEAFTLWSYKDGDLFLKNTKVEVLSADVELKVSADLRPVPASDRFMARGAVRGISMKNLERVLSLDVSLEGDNGMVDFWVSADRGGKTAGKAFVRLPELKADGTQVVKGLRANVFFFPDKSVNVDCTGEVFGAVITGAGGAAPAREGANWNQSMTFTASGINSSLVAAAFPALAPAAPSGTFDLDVMVRGGVSGQSPFALGIEARSPALSLAGIRLNGISASARYVNGLVTLDELRARIGRAPLNLAGTLNLATSALRFDGGIKGLNPRSIPGLTGVTGLCDISLTARGSMTSPEIAATLTGSNNTVMDIPLGRLALSCTYSNNRLTIPESTLRVPGGMLSFRGSVALPPGREPVLDVSCALRNLDLSAYSQIWDVDAAGRVNAAVRLSGPVSDAAVSAVVTSNALTVLSADVRNLDLEFSGTTRNVRVRRLRANINDGLLEGRGGMRFGRDGRLFVDIKVEDLDIRDFLARYGIDAGVGGHLDGELLLRGPFRRPELALKVTSPLTIKETLLDRLSLSIISPARGSFNMEVSGQLGDLELRLNSHMERSERGLDGWSYAAESGLIDLDKLVSARTPSMRGQVSGDAQIQVGGRLMGRRGGETTPVDITISVPAVSFAGVKVKDIHIPISVSGDMAVIHQASGKAYDGEITADGGVDLSKQQWGMNARVSGIDMGKAVRPFLEQGEIVGSADINLRVRGDYGILMMMFANGDFRTSEGYLREFDALKRITDDGSVSFQEARGSFFWDGGELWLNPGTQATAKPGDVLYRFLSVNGSMGLKEKGLNLNFQGRFNVQALDTLISGLRGLFQLTTGSLAATGGRQFITQTVGRMVGLAERDFQNVSFQLRGDWSGLQLLNLKIDKPLENFIPFRASDSLPERRDMENDKRIQFNIKIPTGSGGGADDEGARDQFMRQLLDNLLNWAIDTEF
ncbi:MAG: hypothetical protein FWG71_01195 [Synergistaceae bacterium]|nr:hypothetical protein [Synergistaceae bacterium]